MFLLDVVVNPALILLVLAVENPLATLAVIAVAVLLIIVLIVLKRRR